MPLLPHPLQKKTQGRTKMKRKKNCTRVRFLLGKIKTHVPHAKDSHPSIHPATSTFSHTISFLPSTRLQLRTSSTYRTCHFPLTNHAHTRGVAVASQNTHWTATHSSCDLHGVLPSLAHDLTRHTHTTFITTVQSPRRIHHYVFSNFT